MTDLTHSLSPHHNTTRNTGTEETPSISSVMRAHLSLLLLAALVAAFLGLATVTSAADPKDCEGKQACEEARSQCSVCVVCF